MATATHARTSIEQEINTLGLVPGFFDQIHDYDRFADELEQIGRHMSRART